MDVRVWPRCTGTVFRRTVAASVRVGRGYPDRFYDLFQAIWVGPRSRVSGIGTDRTGKGLLFSLPVVPALA